MSEVGTTLLRRMCDRSNSVKFEFVMVSFTNSDSFSFMRPRQGLSLTPPQRHRLVPAKYTFVAV